MLLSDLREIKTVLEIDQGDTSEDVKLALLIEDASRWIGEILDRPGLSKRERTEYYNGTGTQKIVLKSRPVFTTPTIAVYVDESGFFGSVSGAFSSSTALTYGNEFCLDIDQDDGTSRSAILIRIRNLWPEPAVRQRGYLTPFLGEGFGTIKVVYTAGYTVDTLPAQFRLAMTFLVAKMRQVLPLGFPLTAESYEERSMSYFMPYKNIWLDHVWMMIGSMKNWSW